jgi:hypothetical protein
MAVKFNSNFMLDYCKPDHQHLVEFSIKTNIGVSSQAKHFYTPQIFKQDPLASLQGTRGFTARFINGLHFKFKNPSSLGIDSNELTTVLQNNFTSEIKPANIFGYEIIAAIQQLNTGIDIKCFFPASQAKILPAATSDFIYSQAMTNVLNLLTAFEQNLSKITGKGFIQQLVIEKTQGFAECDSILPNEYFMFTEHEALTNLKNLNTQWTEYLNIIKIFNQPFKKFIMTVKDTYTFEYFSKKDKDMEALYELLNTPLDEYLKKKRNIDAYAEFLKNEILEFISVVKDIDNILAIIEKHTDFNNKEFVARQATNYDLIPAIIEKHAGFNNKGFITRQVTNYDLIPAIDFQRTQKLSSYYVQQNFVVKKPGGYFHNSVKNIFNSYYEVPIYFKPPKLTWLSYISHYQPIPKNILFYSELAQFSQSFFF